MTEQASDLPTHLSSESSLAEWVTFIIHPVLQQASLGKSAKEMVNKRHHWLCLIIILFTEQVHQVKEGATQMKFTYK